MRIANTISDSIVDGPGLRLTVFTQGCPHRCPDCHNPETHDPAGGREAELAELIALLDANPLLQGPVGSGGWYFYHPNINPQTPPAPASRVHPPVRAYR